MPIGSKLFTLSLWESVQPGFIPKVLATWRKATVGPYPSVKKCSPSSPPKQIASCRDFPPEKTASSENRTCSSVQVLAQVLAPFSTEASEIHPDVEKALSTTLFKRRN